MDMPFSKWHRCVGGAGLSGRREVNKQRFSHDAGRKRGDPVLLLSPAQTQEFQMKRWLVRLLILMAAVTPASRQMTCGIKTWYSAYPEEWVVVYAEPTERRPTQENGNKPEFA